MRSAVPVRDAWASRILIALAGPDPYLFRTMTKIISWNLLRLTGASLDDIVRLIRREPGRFDPREIGGARRGAVGAGGIRASVAAAGIAHDMLRLAFTNW